MKNEWWKPDFKTKKALQSAIREIANTAYIGEAIIGDHEEFMINVLSHHSGFDEKCGVGYSYIFVAIDEFKTRHFRIARVDGTDVGISWHHAIKNETSPRKNFFAALREEVKEQIFSFKSASGNVCGICGHYINAGDKHIDHVVPFRDLVENFFGNDVFETVEHDITSTLTDRNIAKKWQEYHLSKAVLQASHSKCNLRKG